MKSTRLAAVILSLCSAACSSPAGPSPTGPSVTAPTGTWGGFFRIESCNPACDVPPGTQYAFLLAITDDGALIRGSLTSEMPRATTASFAGALRGDGAVVLTPTGPASDVQIAFSEIIVARAGDAVTGTLAYRSGTRETVASIPTASRVAPAPALTGSAFDLVGSWAGEYRSDSCTGPNCATTYPRGNDPYSIMVTREGDRLTALLRLGHRVFALQGTPQPDGSAVFIGGPPEPAPSPGDALEMRRFVLRRDAAAGLSGTLHYRVVSEEGATNERATIVSGGRREIVELPGAFQGDWQGDTLVLGCRGDCRYVTVGSGWHGISLKLSERDGIVVGRSTGFGGYPVTGTSSGRTLQLAGRRAEPSCPADWEGYYCSVTLRDFRATVDALGQMRGTFYLDVVYMSMSKSSQTVRLELVNMIHEPTLLK